jgi:release factor glutamine methyltransferase
MSAAMTDSQPRSLADVLATSRAAFSDAGILDSALDARLIVEHYSATSRAQAISTPERIIGAAAVSDIERALRRRISGESVHRILGFREFYGLRLSLSAETLEPRPDTETLVDALLPFVRSVAAREKPCRILDLGTGTGAIALALLTEVEAATATGVDISADALATAHANAVSLRVDSRFTTLISDWFSRISGKFHVIAANPPYIPSNDLMNLQAEVRDFDPARALDGGADGLDAYRTIATHAGAYLEDGGRIGVEIGYGQRDVVSKLFEANGYRVAEARQDIAGRDRVLVFHR